MQPSRLSNTLRHRIRELPLPHRWAFVIGCCIVLYAALASGGGTAQSAKGATSVAGANVDRSSPTSDDQTKMKDQQAKQQSVDEGDQERKKQLSDDTAKLLTLAMALKAEVDKTNKDTLSLNVIRKADEIEKLARNVKEKMK